MESSRQTLATGNLVRGLPSRSMPQELMETLVERSGVKVERIMSTGHTTPHDAWYDQDKDEWVLVVSGSARLRIEGENEDRTFSPGDWIFLPAHCRHRVTWTQAEPPTIWLAVHF